MRILLLADYYPPYLKSFHAEHPADGLTYEQALEAMLADYYGVFVSYRNHFRRLGHQCELVIGNDYLLQGKWLAETGITESVTPQTKYKAVLARIEAFRPDVMFLGSMFDYFGDFMAAASRITPNIFAWIACPYPKALDMRGIRCVISSVDAFVEDFRTMGLAAERLDAAFDADIAAALGNVPKKYDVTFIGGLSSRSHGYRVRMLKDLLRAGISVDLWGYGLDSGILPNPLRKHLRGEVWAMDYYRVLAQSRMTLNFHIDVARTSGFTGNMRTFEATGCGAALVTDASGEVGRLFEPGSEVVTYASYDELIVRLRELLANPGQAEAIGKRGQQRCLETHGYDVRILQFERILVEHTV